MGRCVFFFQAEDGIRDAQESRGLGGDVYKRQEQVRDPLAKYLERLDSRTTTPAPMNPNLKKAAPLTSPSSTTAPTKFQPTLLPTASKALKGATTAQQQRPPARSTPVSYTHLTLPTKRIV
eukprot:TRINITY_DN55268_c0_g1_i1.p1 TRINITY_DN55268_c0_g1~~TRINITY_DN55268_c0_g1_i1.p1  ORF type:complete len:121 (+),score=33.79 TRINITY_DN55268_c0_g1_i1:91-453(+)